MIAALLALLVEVLEFVVDNGIAVPPRPPPHMGLGALSSDMTSPTNSSDSCMVE
eukprot:CAMPEP_0196185806 /NCGR_PEP_ID=MMETSP0911-20130528/36952_1 /TAXON_ID=49265 /ORGANISM="Thalassiosira rotula, Strain GSO102" /LENGTH=53 /DNA_ID=CAMNT_0041456417 /DNA_START=457 /DNA_END=618 /DNA_ORIENTATION=+